MSALSNSGGESSKTPPFSGSRPYLPPDEGQKWGAGPIRILDKGIFQRPPSE